MFRGLEWKTNTLMTAFFYPGSVFAIMFVLNTMLWAQGKCMIHLQKVQVLLHHTSYTISRQQRRHPLLRRLHTALSVVLRLGAACVSGQLLRVQEGVHVLPRAHQPHPQSYSSAGMCRYV
ncbi:hypothetical protein EON63_10990 [archaeon]|nr:MAG: hypothetical protein EON63_10990 [archaeon]